MKNSKLISIMIVIGLISGFIGGTLTNRVTLTQEGKEVNIIQPVKLQVVNEESKTIDAIQKVSPAVVSIIVSKDFEIIQSNPFLFNDPFFFYDPFGDNPFQQPQQQPETEKRTQQIGGGTGFIFTSDGLIITNRHVVNDTDAQYTVILQSGEYYEAEVVDRDTINDLAVVKIIASKDKEVPKNLPVVTLGDSKKIKVGQQVIAIGNALSEFSNTVTTGVISAMGRSIQASDGYGRGENLSGLLQTDAAINPGNSGGPLVNLEGEVIGVNTAIAAGANGLGFAIPINDIKSIILSVKENGRIIRPVLGVRYIMLDEKSIKDFDVTGVSEGALLMGNSLNGEPAVIKDRPAYKAGLKEGDVITQVDGKKIDKETSLQDVISGHKVGDIIDITYFRDGNINTTKAELTESKNLAGKE